MKKELVVFKGMADGVKIYVDPEAPMFNILEELDEKINGSRSFFGDGNCRICFTGRIFTGGERQRLGQLTEGLLPSAKIDFEQRQKKSVYNEKWIEEYKKRYGITDNVFSEQDTGDNAHADRHMEEKSGEDKTEHEFLSTLKSSRARFYQGVIHDGVSISSEGHLILLGTVEKGGEIEAVGNIIVIGGLYGSAHAGCNGHNGSYIIAMDMAPERLAIAGASESYDTDDKSNDVSDDAKKAEPGKRSFFDKLIKRNGNDANISDEHIEKTEKREKNTVETEKSAVALWKNNKIILDNFTIRAFTNLKNMI